MKKSSLILSFCAVLALSVSVAANSKARASTEHVVSDTKVVKESCFVSPVTFNVIQAVDFDVNDYTITYAESVQNAYILAPNKSIDCVFGSPVKTYADDVGWHFTSGNYSIKNRYLFICSIRQCLSFKHYRLSKKAKPK